MDHLKIKDALPILYKSYNLKPDGGLHDSSVKIELLKKFSLYIPNFETRQKVVLKHDIHHVVTGYSAEMKGETEISAWELSTGCTHNWFAFSINILGMMSGVLFNLPGIWRAWMRGKTTKNLYNEKYKLEAVLNQTAEELQEELGLRNANATSASVSGFLSFMGFLFFGTLLSILSIVLIPWVIVYSIFISIQKNHGNRT
jgi:hypothetical protein